MTPSWAGMFLLALAVSAMADSPSKSAECLTCHDEKGASFHASVHGSLSCTDCHTPIKGYPHAANSAPVKCDTCHGEAAAGLKASVHAGVSSQPCQGCHGEPHAILQATNPKSSTYPSNLPRACGTCHGDVKFAQSHGMKEVYSQYMDSIHGFALTKDGLLVAASCTSCHGSHAILSKTDPKSRTNRVNIAGTCGSCHAGAQKAYQDGIHGQRLRAGNSRAPACTDCHTAHQISNPNTAAWQMKTGATCGQCHQENFKTYHDTFHAQVSALGYVESAHCWDCHGSHDILPATDAKSTIAAANLTATCGKCHSGVTKGFVSYQPHADKRKMRDYPALWATSVFMNLLLAGVLGFFALHTLLWLNRALRERTAEK
ncbi:MAG TPA: cytochrome c3 family protein [Bryobacteraceae bacterium]|nr:cytochrome c3 family protein [Bryobacteraceae bacterium]